MNHSALPYVRNQDSFESPRPDLSFRKLRYVPADSGEINGAQNQGSKIDLGGTPLRSASAIRHLSHQQPKLPALQNHETTHDNLLDTGRDSQELPIDDKRPPTKRLLPGLSNTVIGVNVHQERSTDTEPHTDKVCKVVGSLSSKRSTSGLANRGSSQDFRGKIAVRRSCSPCRTSPNTAAITAGAASPLLGCCRRRLLGDRQVENISAGGSASSSAASDQETPTVSEEPIVNCPAETIFAPGTVAVDSSPKSTEPATPSAEPAVEVSITVTVAQWHMGSETASIMFECTAACRGLSRSASPFLRLRLGPCPR